MSLFDFDAIQPELSKEAILSRYLTEDIYKAVYPQFTLGTTVSPFRKDDNPSFSFHNKSETGEVLWKDQKTNEKGDIFDFVKKFFLIHYQRKLNFGQVLSEIDKAMRNQVGWEPMEVKLNNGQVMNVPVPQGKAPKPIITAIVPQKVWMPSFGFRYWESQNISRNVLRMYDTQFAEEIWLKRWKEGEWKLTRWGESTPSDPIFFWQFPSGNIKCYRPLTKNKKLKWLSTIDSKVDVQGLVQADIERRYPGVLVLTKSMKDVMLLRTFGINAIALHGEGYKPTLQFILYLLRYCEILISVYDNDWRGIRSALYLYEEFLIPPLIIPQKTGFKDCAELNLGNYPLLNQNILTIKNTLEEIYGINNIAFLGTGSLRRLYPRTISEIGRRFFGYKYVERGPEESIRWTGELRSTLGSAAW